ncbi:uncharacterized protein LOC110465526 isoform X2 [Mizuhopecten yessoensis]|nr:uncharacterized protein LOC110465526 isoform X2 [Mizuhopecten yessoensis]
MWDLDDVGIAYTGNTSDHLTPRMATPPTLNPQSKDSAMIPTPTAMSNRVKQLTQVSILGKKPNPHRPIYSPSDALDTYKFRDLFPNPELKKEMTNCLGKINAGGAFVVDNNITMHGDVMMLDLDSEGEGHSSHTHTAVEKFSQLTETPMTVTKPTNALTTTTGIRHLMTLRNPDLADLPSGSDINLEKKRKRKKRKHKHAKITKNDTCLSETQDTEEPLSCVVPPSQKVVSDKTKTEKKPVEFTKMLRYQMRRFRAYIQKKMICR